MNLKLLGVASASALSAVTLSVMDANPTLFLYDRLVATDRRRRRALAGKRVWITGASSGIGAELAAQLSQHGARLVLSARDKTKLERVAERCRRATETPTDVRVLPFDATTPDDAALAETVRTAAKCFAATDGGGGASENDDDEGGIIDVLILNAGRGQTSTALLSSVTETRELMELNYLAPVRLAAEVIRHQRWDNDSSTSSSSSDRHIVVTSSVAAKLALPLSTSYAASKFAVHGYFTSLRSEYGRWLRVDLPMPGPVRTAFSRNALTPSHRPNDADSDNDSNGKDEKKMNAERCAQLIIAGMIGPKSLFYETWIAEQPTLSVLAISQYLPTLGNLLLQWLGRIRVKAWEEGLPLYELSGWIKARDMIAEEDRKKEKVEKKQPK